MSRVKSERSASPQAVVAKLEGTRVDEVSGSGTEVKETRPARRGPPVLKRSNSAIGEGGEPRPRKRTRTARIINQAPSQRLRVVVFGSGESGELGLGPAVKSGPRPDLAERPRANHFLDPVTVGVVQLAVGGMHCAALTHDGRVLTWGVNDSKALGRDTDPEAVLQDATDLNPLESTPDEVRGIADLGLTVTQVAATDNATFVLTAQGLVYGWGTFFGNDGAFGFLKEKIQGRAKPTPEQRFQFTPIQIAGLRDVKELAAGVNHVLALTHSGVVYAWGSGHQAELGRRLIFRHQAQSLVPRAVNLPRKGVVAIFAGFHHNFALDKKGRVWTWGLNNFGQTGIPIDDDNLHVGAPEVVRGLQGHHIACIAGGFHHTIACTDDGRVLAWGRCDDGQLGIDIDSLPRDNVLFDSRQKPRIVSIPTAIPGIEASHVAAAIDNSLAINAQGQVLSWGFSECYRTGLGTEKSMDKPTLLSGKVVENSKFTFAGCGGQFSVIAGPPHSEKHITM